MKTIENHISASAIILVHSVCGLNMIWNVALTWLKCGLNMTPNVAWLDDLTSENDDIRKNGTSENFGGIEDSQKKMKTKKNMLSRKIRGYLEIQEKHVIQKHGTFGKFGGAQKIRKHMISGKKGTFENFGHTFRVSAAHSQSYTCPHNGCHLIFIWFSYDFPWLLNHFMWFSYDLIWFLFFRLLCEK